MELKALLQEMIDKKASDVFIVAGLPLTYTCLLYTSRCV